MPNMENDDFIRRNKAEQERIMRERTGVNATGTSEKKESEFYLNIGMDKLNVHTDEMVFVTLPQKLFLDTMKKNTIFGDSEKNFAYRVGNLMLDRIIEKAEETLKPGEYMELPVNFKIRVYRKGDPVEQASEDIADMDFGL